MFKKIEKYIFIGIVIFIIIILLCCLWNERGRSARMSYLNRQYREQIKSANDRIREFETIGETQRRTISNLEAIKQQYGNRIEELERLQQQSNNSIGTIETGNQQDRKDLQRLREIIKKNGKGK